VDAAAPLGREADLGEVGIVEVRRLFALLAKAPHEPLGEESAH